MTQEKKVIRVLTPNKKAKKFSPMLFGIIGTAFGVIATSVLLFTFLKEDSSSAAIQTQNHKSAESIAAVPPKPTTETLTAQTDQNNQAVEQAPEVEMDDEHEGFNQPQPKLNEITQVFQHKKEAPVATVAEPKPSGNPFDTFKPAPKPVAAAAVPRPKPSLPEKALPGKTSVPAQPTVKAAVKPEPMTAKTAAKEPQKAKAAEKEADYEVPHATVQIAVTRSVKE
ncbi:hypothetical protein AMD27_16000 [Acinetobacter sp. TGL-Y2]|uniref:hypothetical protein n=1 Tax=Acinetobacter sp. TGL-Y2 TaxID=1407071 RepID=UPI0007A66D9A|nr:hypothetical protein [Acinetobacter sp. TGL-Y2]AMW80252.1 hypothetical protein AMD27_16000 [Acinetobacter sp. TGL-Y2]